MQIFIFCEYFVLFFSVLMLFYFLWIWWFIFHKFQKCSLVLIVLPPYNVATKMSSLQHRQLNLYDFLILKHDILLFVLYVDDNADDVFFFFVYFLSLQSVNFLLTTNELICTDMFQICCCYGISSNKKYLNIILYTIFIFSICFCFVFLLFL